MIPGFKSLHTQDIKFNHKPMINKTSFGFAPDTAMSNNPQCVYVLYLFPFCISGVKFSV